MNNLMFLPSKTEKVRHSQSADGVADPVYALEYVSGTGTDLTLPDGPSDGDCIKIFVITGGIGTLTPTNLADGTLHVITWAGSASFILLWDHVDATWRVVGAPLGAVVT